jgi:hypothetical protein
VIKKYKSKFKSFEIDHIKLKASHDKLLVRHNEVVETHESYVVSSKQLREGS